jgi:hypothetical protein
MIAIPITNPPKISHTAAEVKPPKMTFAGEIENNIATRKKSSEVKCSGIMPVAHKTMVINASAATLDSDGRRNVGGTQRRASAPVQESSVRMTFKRIAE